MGARYQEGALEEADSMSMHVFSSQFAH